MDVNKLADLIKAEWSASYSDDGRVWRKAKEELSAALALVGKSTEDEAYKIARDTFR
jgi:hypothetical protein